MSMSRLREDQLVTTLWTRESHCKIASTTEQQVYLKVFKGWREKIWAHNLESRYSQLMSKLRTSYLKRTTTENYRENALRAR